MAQAVDGIKIPHMYKSVIDLRVGDKQQIGYNSNCMKR